MTCFHAGSTATDKKAKCSSFENQLLFIFAKPEYSGAALLHYYSKFTQTLGLRHYFVTRNILRYLVDFFFSALDISSPVQ
jgi:hypothetical protein